MKKMFFLTAIFQNKFGKAKKYYDEKGWHWMLPSDKPKLYSTFESAKRDADELAKDILSEIIITEITVYENLWEHKIELEIDFSPREIVFEKKEKGAHIFLSFQKQSESAKPVDGLFKIDQQNDTWIYGQEKSHLSFDTNPEDLIVQSFFKLQEAKALMQIFDYDKSHINKVDGVMIFVGRLIKTKQNLDSSDSDIGTTPEDLISVSYSKLQDAKKIMESLGYGKTEISKVEGVMIFVRKLMN